jgi:hypothetical protein
MPALDLIVSFKYLQGHLKAINLIKNICLSKLLPVYLLKPKTNFNMEQQNQNPDAGLFGLSIDTTGREHLPLLGYSYNNRTYLFRACLCYCNPGKSKYVE